MLPVPGPMDPHGTWRRSSRWYGSARSNTTTTCGLVNLLGRNLMVGGTMWQNFRKLLHSSLRHRGIMNHKDSFRKHTRLSKAGVFWKQLQDTSYIKTLRSCLEFLGTFQFSSTPNLPWCLTRTFRTRAWHNDCNMSCVKNPFRFC